MTVWQSQSNLNKGELDDTLQGRRDTDMYYGGLSRARDVVLKPQGGVKKRNGTKYLYSTWADEDPSLLFKFSFNEQTNYVLAIAPGKTTNTVMYIFKNGVLQTNINGSGNDYLDFGVIFDANNFRINYTQSANTAIICNGLDQPMVISRTSDTQWTCTAINFTNVPQYDFNDASSPTPANEVQQITFTNANESDRFKLSIDGFLSEEVTYTLDTAEMETRLTDAIQGMDNTANSGVSVSNSAPNIYDITFGGDSASPYGLTQAIPVITRSTSFQGVSTRTTPGVSRKEDAFSTTRGWPRCSTFHQGRLYFAGTDSLPDSIFGSVVGDFFNFDQGKAFDDEGIFVTLQTDQVNYINALVSTRKLQAFTTGAEFFCPEDVITPTSVRFDQFSNYGINYVQPVTLDGTVIYPQGDSRALILSEITNQYQPIATRNLSVLAPELTASVRELSISRGQTDTDANYIYLVSTLDGSSKITCLNYLPSEGVEGFSQWDLSGGINSVAVVDNLFYVLVGRNGTVYLEVEEPTFNVDCGLELFNDTTIDTSHYTGTVEAVGDGAYLGEFTSSASVALGRTVSRGYIGIPYRPTVRTMPINQQFPNGNTYAMKKRVRRAIIEYYLSNGVQVKNYIDDVETFSQNIPDRTIGVNQFEAPVPSTEIKRVPMYGGYGIKNQIEVTQSTPLDFFLLSIGAEVKT